MTELHYGGAQPAEAMGWQRATRAYAEFYAPPPTVCHSKLTGGSAIVTPPSPPNTAPAVVSHHRHLVSS